jgi:RES domain-containing protein
MLLYRLAKCKYVNDLSGAGARLYGGRWNSEGQPMVYTASSRALAVLEVLVHIAPKDLPDDFCMMIIEAPDDVEVLDLNFLPPGWPEYPEINVLKTIGNDFLRRAEHLMLKVPSAVVTEEFNFLINPQHPKASQIRMSGTRPFVFDPRLRP